MSQVLGLVLASLLVVLLVAVLWTLLVAVPLGLVTDEFLGSLLGALLPEVLRGLLLMSRLGALLLALLPEVLRGLLLLYPCCITLCRLVAGKRSSEGSPLLANRSSSLRVSTTHTEQPIDKGCGSAAYSTHKGTTH